MNNFKKWKGPFNFAALYPIPLHSINLNNLIYKVFL